MKIKLLILIVLFSGLYATSVEAAVWYDKLPESGEVAPKETVSEGVPLDFVEGQNITPPPPSSSTQPTQALDLNQEDKKESLSQETGVQEEKGIGYFWTVGFFLSLILTVVIRRVYVWWKTD